MAHGHFSHFVALWWSLVATVFLLVVTLGCGQRTSGLKKVYFIQVDGLSVGVQGYCDSGGCHTPHVPFYLDQVASGVNKQHELKVGGQAIWVLYVIATGLWGMCWLFGILASHTIRHFFVMASTLATLCAIVASGLATGIYISYYNAVKGNGGSGSAKVGSVALALTWVGTAAAILAWLFWFSWSRRPVIVRER